MRICLPRDGFATGDSPNNTCTSSLGVLHDSTVINTDYLYWYCLSCLNQMVFQVTVV